MDAVALLGAGRMAQLHAAAIAGAGARVATIFDSVRAAADALAARTGARAAAIDDTSVDAVIIAPPTPTSG